MKTTNYLLLFVFVCTFLSCKTEVKKEEAPEIEELVVVEEKTIYEKLGGAEGISAAVDQIVAKHIENDLIKHYFIPLQENPEYFEQFDQLLLKFLLHPRVFHILFFLQQQQALQPLVPLLF